jgi:hypothetical protein
MLPKTKSGANQEISPTPGGMSFLSGVRNALDSWEWFLTNWGCWLLWHFYMWWSQDLFQLVGHQPVAQHIWTWRQIYPLYYFEIWTGHGVQLFGIKACVSLLEKKMRWILDMIETYVGWDCHGSSHSISFPLSIDLGHLSQHSLKLSGVIWSPNQMDGLSYNKH